MSFPSRLWAAVERKGTPAMIGVDPRPAKFPEPFRARAVGRGAAGAAAAMRDYHRALLDVLAPRVPAVKPNAAFFEELGPDGFGALADCVAHARALGLIVVMDAKRGDIGSTAEAYASTFLAGGYEGAFPAADALTVNPYLGSDAVAPFLEAARAHDAGLFVLVKTSNPGADEFQGHGTPPLAQRVAAAVAQWGAALVDSSGWSSVGAVVGATRPEELAVFRALMPRAPLLLPGFGFQGGEARGLAPAFDALGRGAVVNASRSVLWAHERADLQHLPGWEARVDAAVQEMVDALRPVARAVR
ncbi:MAG: orotidine-5'-phosphate decarboxylase [Planctomycetota bacterium]|nr:MAG: orotidine-5'-phosphate decarboxylase [Planctomycetota bacterium]